MEILEERISDILVESIQFDRATISEAKLLSDKITKGMNDGFVKIIIDLSTCDYIDSTFLGVLVTTLKRTAKLKGDVRLVGLRPKVLAMFEITRMFRVFQTYSHLQKAIESFNEIT